MILSLYLEFNKFCFNSRFLIQGKFSRFDSLNHGYPPNNSSEHSPLNVNSWFKFTFSNKYNNEELSGQDLNSIINILIEANKRNYIYNKNEYLTNLILYKDCITYFIIGKGYFYYIIKMLRNNKVTSAKIILDNKEYYLYVELIK